MKPKWLEVAESHVGTAEVYGAGNNPKISEWLGRLGAWWRDDATPWCGVFCAECMREAGVGYPKQYYRAGEWLNWGAYLAHPLLGCIGVKKRKGGNHVFFVVGVNKDGTRVVGLGGNQSDAVTYATFAINEVTGWRWPYNVPRGYPLPVINTNVLLSTKES